MGTNLVVVRQIIAGLRERGFDRSEKGQGGGWTVACNFAVTTLRDIYEALGQPIMLAIGNRTEAPGCPVEQAVNAVLGDTFEAAEALPLKRFGGVTLADLTADFRTRLEARGVAATAIPTLETEHVE